MQETTAFGLNAGFAPLKIIFHRTICLNKICAWNKILSESESETFIKKVPSSFRAVQQWEWLHQGALSNERGNLQVGPQCGFLHCTGAQASKVIN